MNYIEIIKDIMLEQNLSQEKMGEILNVNQTTIGKWLRGERKPTYDNILKFYEKFGIEPNDFFGINKDL